MVDMQATPPLGAAQPADDQRLEEALRNAAAAGDTDAASKIAQEIRSRRATGDQQPGVTTPPPTVDPLGSIPLEISGVKLSQETREALLAGQKMTDPREKRLLAARIGGRIAAMSDEGNFADDIARSDFGVALRSFSSGIFGIGDLAAAAGTFAATDLSFGEALEAQREFRRAMEEDRPLLTIASEVAGSFVGGGGIALGIKALSKGKKGLEVLDKLTTFKKGKKLANIGKASLAGSIGGAITEGITEDEPLRGAGFGALGGPVGLGLARGLGVTLDVLKGGVLRAAQILPRQIADFLDDPAAKGIKVLAKKMGVSEKEMSRRFLEFKAVTGKNPSIADITNPQASAELRDVIASSAGATEVARKAAERTLGTRAREISEQVTGGKFTTSVERLDKTARDIAKKRFAAAKKDNITFQPGEVQEILLDRNMRVILAKSPNTRVALGELIDEAGEGGAVTIKGELADSIRGTLVAARELNPASEASVLLRSFDDVIRAESKNFDEAIGGLERRLIGKEGFQVGQRVTTGKLSESAIETQAISVAERGAPGRAFAGARTGARSRVAAEAREGVNASARLAKTLSEDSGLIQRLRTVLPAREVDRLQQIGRLQTRSIENIGKLVPSAKVNTDLQRAVSDVVNSTVIASTGTSLASKIFAFGRIMKNLGTGLDDRVIENLAKDAFDPKKTQKVIAAMRRIEISEENIITIFASSAAGGIGAAQFEEEGSSHKDDGNTDHLLSDR